MALKRELVTILAENRNLAFELDWWNTTLGGTSEVKAAAPSLNRMIVWVGALGLLIISGGICAIILNAVSETKINIAGMSILTGHVGVAFVGLGIIMVMRVYRHVSSILFKLAELPDDRPRKKSTSRQQGSR
jgi:hypothetical protein